MLNMSVPLSGLRANTVRLNASANNLANMNSDGALPAAGQKSASPEPYKPVQVRQTSTGTTGGTAATVTNVHPSFVAKLDPGASYANSQGQVAAPNVDALNETLNVTTAKADFTVNTKVADAINQMVKQLFDLGIDEQPPA